MITLSASEDESREEVNKPGTSKAQEENMPSTSKAGGSSNVKTEPL